ncbi:MAG: hypothetical protein A2958_03335 [Candidatus Levybacteria bacterium RIFCSPLOWO2_01_FULL_38_13]|uniref:Glycosyltransferase 2-like domain-containing protein n=1 Tax=Candidatus Roizmanbacteria bacterium RIFCSPHIGHO2_12_FULL_33_9 TaxID=1802045 RepID=A0A1F7HJ94_9BACT|nr:MAG: hypothetical protein A2629_03750 [Candidatus Levybacteria bacterium RIFCSPHIGHO2_01_FULL_41_15]OGH35346.1 MAG: hypothetical protein A2958_03335 [Candidatus Levybacteria bacterium RIFCSPLOWO2_01_FULL_38_13]OGK31290.1 MAG: hypothetical protein A3F29_02390 [Candidatus Roizmanbacteria bacterium RIFCSPHIGHO2_12_FULL_33_9]
MNSNVSLIIVSYKVKREIFNCIRSIIESKPKINFEIIVVDNDEKNTIEEDLKKQFPRVKYVKSPKNIGFGAGCNLGSKYARGEVLFLVNPDTEVPEGTIDNLYNFLISDKNIGAVSPILLNNRGVPYFVQGSELINPINAVFSLSGIYKLFPKNWIAENFFYKDWDRKAVREMDVVPGTSLMIKKKVFDEIGGFDEEFFLFFEEADLCKRLKIKGYRNYSVPDAKIIHFGGISTKKRNDIKEIFSKSRFYYFKKWYGSFLALILKLFFRFNKNLLFLTIILFLAALLRFYKLGSTMEFIGDQGWFYLSARDLLLTGNIPLVGITSSHTWLHQGPLWTYILSLIFLISNFNPVAPAYFTAIFSVLSTFLIYRVGTILFSRQTGLVSGLLYAVSPLTVLHSRMPYHTTLIPFFSLLFILFIYKWLSGKAMFFPAVILVLSILYNLELSTTSLWIVLVLFMVYGIYKKKQFVSKLKNPKIILLSIIGFIVPMLPILIYDFNHGFPQTFKFIAWIGYKFLKFFGLPGVGSITEQSSYLTVLNFFLESYGRLIFAESYQIALILLIISFSLFFFILYKDIGKKKIQLGYLLIGIYFIISFLGFLIAKTSSEAYLPIFFPPIIIIAGLVFNKLIVSNTFKLIGITFLIILVSFNVYPLFKNNSRINEGLSFKNRLNAVGRIIALTQDQEYNLLGKGEGSQFESFTMNYEYLLWWKSHPASRESVKTKIIISETSKGIIIEKK